MVSIDPIAVVVGAVGYQVLGALWYGPLFGDRWIAAMGLEDPHEAGMDNQNLGYAATAVGALVATLALAVLVDFAGAATWQDGLVLGLLAGVGFVATTSVQTVAFEGRSPVVTGINVAYNAVALAGIGVLLAIW